MKKEFLKSIRCPACNTQNGSLKIAEEGHNEVEIRKGSVICGACQRSYKITNGIVDLLYNPDKRVQAEIEGNIKVAEDRSKFKDENLLGLPESAENPDPLHESYAYSVNFYKIIEELKLTGEESVLDLGSGTSWSSNKLAEKGCRCTALDISLDKHVGLESADVFFSHNKVFYERVRSDMKSLPFVDGCFDIVMTNSSLHHSTELRTTIKEMARVLKKGGRLAIINEPVCSIFLLNRTGRRKHLPSYVHRYSWTEKIYSILEYIHLLKLCGFKIKIFYPISISRKLEALRSRGVSLKKKRFKQKLGYILSFLWGIDALKSFAEKYLFWPGMVLFGMPLLAIARKEKG